MILYKMTNDDKIVKFTHDSYFKLSRTIAEKRLGDRKYSNIVMRVAMDNMINEPWEHVFTSPAYKNMHITDLQRVIVILMKMMKNNGYLLNCFLESNAIRTIKTSKKPLIKESLIDKIRVLCG